MMLIKDQFKRPDANDLLNHPFVKEFMKEFQKEQDES